MAKFLFAYSGGKMAETEEARQKSYDDWSNWFKDLGDKVADMGAPTDQSKRVNTTGVGEVGGEVLSGYSVIQADSLDAAVEIAKTCPMLGDGGNVDVYQAVDM